MGIGLSRFVADNDVVYDGERESLKKRLFGFQVEIECDAPSLYVRHHDGRKGMDMYPVPPGTITGVSPAKGYEERLSVKDGSTGGRPAIVVVSTGLDVDRLHVFRSPSQKYCPKIYADPSQIDDQIESKAGLLSRLNMEIKQNEAVLGGIAEGLRLFQNGGYVGYVNRLRRMEQQNPEAFAQFMSRFMENDAEAVTHAMKCGGFRMRGKLRPPESEDELRQIFDRYAYLMGIRILHYQTGFPDYTIQRGSDTLRAEAELFSRNFVEHGHDPGGCDLIVCWEDNLIDSLGLEVLEISTRRYKRPDCEASQVPLIELPEKL